jgi:iduronate 2-sulfatase
MKKITSALVLLVVGSAIFAADKPNVLFIAIDDMRPEIGCYGGPQVKSPNLDKLAGQGVLFSRAYCNVPVCGASRASLMTGVLPTKSRFRNYFTRADVDAPDATTLGEAFKNAGYTTISNGKIFHHPDDSEKESWSEKAWRAKPPKKSYDPATTAKLSKRKRGRIYELPAVADNAYGDGLVAEKTISDLRKLKEKNKPFFLACGFIKPHMPFYAPKKYWDLYDRSKIELADNRFRPKDAPSALRGSNEFKSYHLADMEVNSDEFHRVMRHGYLACVSYVDKLVGDVLTELDRLGLAENTIVVVWGDHGWHLGEHTFWGKHNTMHLATRVPLIVRAPGKKTGKTAALVETSDIYPTLCELAKIPVPASVQGKSFVSILDDPEKPFRNVVYTRFGGGDAVVTDQFNYTSYGGKSDMLYDLKKDPNENVNVVGKPDYAETVAMMKKHLAARKKQASEAKGLGKPIPPKPKKKK